MYVISHTHWDREWYQPFQHFRMRLIRLMDRLLALLERDPRFTHFNLDGQTIVLNDYLEIRPDAREALAQFVREGRLGVGPWYVLPDEFLVSGESLVRNLLLGHRIAESFGRVQKAGYIPDTFGHISQLPQILRGFGIGTAMHFRGLDEGGLKQELWWESPDGSRVLLRHLPTYAGYTSACVISHHRQTAIGDLVSLARKEAERARGPVLLAMNGVDHMEARTDLADLLAEANATVRGLAFRQASLEEYFAALAESLDLDALQVVRGELRDTNRTPGRGVMRVLPHILSSRIYNKQQNARTQGLLERWAEPWCSVAWLAGQPYPAAELWRAWDWLLQNHPHDSIGGCSVDAVHSQMETRFAWATEIAEWLVQDRFYSLAHDIDLSALAADEVALVLFNSLPWAWEGVVTADVDLPVDFLNRWALAQRPQPPAALTADSDYLDIYRWRPHLEWAGNPPILPDPAFRSLQIRALGERDALPVQLESQARMTQTYSQESGHTLQQVVRARVSFRASIPALGYATYAVRPDAKPDKPAAQRYPANVLENAHLRVEIAADGTLTVTDRATGEVYRRLGYFEDGGDAGDGYNYSYPARDRVYNTLGLAPRISRLADGPAVQRYAIEYDWPLPAALDDRRQQRQEALVTCGLRVVVSLAADAPRVDVEVTFDNRARDHRLRMLFPSDVATDASRSDTAFDVVTRPVVPVPVSHEAWEEDPPATYPMQSWMDLSDGQRGLCLITEGLPEFEVLDTEAREVAVTLLRAVAYLAGTKADLQTANAGGGPNLATPEAQIQRTLTYRLAILPHRGTWDAAEVWRQALAHNTAPQSVVVERSLFRAGTQPPALGFLAIEGRNAVLSAVKRAEAGDALIVRLYNPSDDPVEATITLAQAIRDAAFVGLDEQPTNEAAPLLSDDGRQVQLGIRLRQIRTLRLSPAREA